MRKRWIAAAAAAVVCGLLFAGGLQAGGRYDTGDPDLDVALQAVDRKAREGLGDFAHIMGRKFDLPPEMVDWMLDQAGLSPGDAYMAAKVSQVAGRPVREVVDAYRENPGQGWGAVARRMGIKPGSAAFHALKAGDEDLTGAADAGPGKGKGKSKGRGKKGKGKK